MKTACPKCGGRICGFDVIFARSDIWTWEMENGVPVPEWNGNRYGVWHSQAPENPDKPYGCDTCGQNFAVADLTFEEDE
jgi:DNA-directed RNA polymerase subunit RPC12/RpoP